LPYLTLQALQLCPEDKTALVARSKCYLLLGQPRLALQDAENALGPDRSNVRAIFQKAEALYHMGDFEHSLMYYHRGLRLRPELAVFRLGVQKAQEAIENTIGKLSFSGHRGKLQNNGGNGASQIWPVRYSVQKHTHDLTRHFILKQQLPLHQHTRNMTTKVEK
ncbi:outer dynein arm-docking complex subunit 4-like, partial [Frankliniella occidentalis]|uniref:Outer dynein arm-docking complex subunit 4 n=1 Tax=Frankliniella occidentalis TaxID=133901 RepID=A0A9C6XUD8_FRAOC